MNEPLPLKWAPGFHWKSVLPSNAADSLTGTLRLAPTEVRPANVADLGVAEDVSIIDGIFKLAV